MTEYQSLKVVELKAELEKRDLDTKGLKADLVARLESSDADSKTNGKGVKRSAESGVEDEEPQTKKAKVEEVPNATDDRLTGKLKWFNLQRNFGFITPDDGTADMFFHRSNVSAPKNFRSLTPGQPVEYSTELDQKTNRLRAKNVTAPDGGMVDAEVQVDPNDPETFPQPSTEELAEGKLRGVCKWFNVQKGFGFITPADGTQDVFVHQSALQVKQGGFRALLTGEHLEFGVEEEEKDGKLRRKALNVTGPSGKNVVGINPVPEPPLITRPVLGGMYPDQRYIDHRFTGGYNGGYGEMPAYRPGYGR